MKLVVTPQMIKDQMDKKFGSPWHVVVGKGFAYEITYEVGSQQRPALKKRQPGQAWLARLCCAVLLGWLLIAALYVPTETRCNCRLPQNWRR